jgi:hypothetical protein
MTTKPPKLTHAEVRLIKEMVAGKSKSMAGMLATGSNTLASGASQASRMLKKDDVQLALAQAFEKHGITLDTAIAPIGKGLKAVKQNEYTGEITEDIGTQLKASDRALKLMGIGQDRETPSIHFHQHTEGKKGDYEF